MDRTGTPAQAAQRQLDAHVRGSEAARTWLASGALREATGGAVDVEWK